MKIKPHHQIIIDNWELGTEEIVKKLEEYTGNEWGVRRFGSMIKYMRKHGIELKYREKYRPKKESEIRRKTKDEIRKFIILNKDKMTLKEMANKLSLSVFQVRGFLAGINRVDRKDKFDGVYTNKQVLSMRWV